ncbi:hypothetical protein [Rufibacter ruber]|uniref:hypothetical protein n=1 Tax=Rufibacter ruber TaxID=1783499 RepID=UPI0008376151|nr:hypothetical protein [Rufibacter ruber]
MLSNRSDFWFSGQQLRPAALTFLPFLVWGLLQVLLYIKFGVQVPRDAQARFIPYAQEIVQHFQYEPGLNIRYASYATLMAAFLKAGLPFGFLIGFQVLLSGLALYLVQRMVAAFTNSRLCAAVAALLVASSQDMHQWNFYMLTESVFTSSLIFCLATLVLIKNCVYLWFSLPLWLFTCFVRPNGFIIVAAAAVYFFTSFYMKATAAQRRLFWIGVGATGIVLLLVINQLLGPFTLVETYARGEVIYGTYYSPLTPPGSSFFYRITPPDTLQMPPTQAPALLKLFLFFWHNPVYSLKLALAKGFTFLIFAKPHFSKLHNFLIIATVYPCYLLTVMALRRRKNLPITLTLLSVIGLQTVMVMFTVEDWDCRFTAPILPFVFMLGAMGIKSIWGEKLPHWDSITTNGNKL